MYRIQISKLKSDEKILIVRARMLRLALVVWSKGATSATSFSLDVGTGKITYRGFLPVVLRDYSYAATIPCPSPLFISRR